MRRSTHVAGGATLEKAATILMVHGAALLGLAALVARAGSAGRSPAATALAAARRFGLDVTLLTLSRPSALSYAAPIGGSTMTPPWLIVGLCSPGTARATREPRGPHRSADGSVVRLR